MGLLSNIGIGIGAAGKAAEPFVLKDMEAKIQELRDTRMAELAKGAAKYSADLAIENIPREQAARLPGLIAAEKAKNDLQYSPESIAGERALAKAKHIEPTDRGAALRNIQTEMATLQLARAKEESKIPPAESKMLDSLAKQSDILMTAMAKSDFDPTTPNGIKTVQDAANIQQKYADTISPFLKGGGMLSGDSGVSSGTGRLKYDPATGGFGGATESKTKAPQAAAETKKTIQPTAEENRQKQLALNSKRNMLEQQAKWINNPPNGDEAQKAKFREIGRKAAEELKSLPQMAY